MQTSVFKHCSGVSCPVTSYNGLCGNSLAYFQRLSKAFHHRSHILSLQGKVHLANAADDRLRATTGYDPFCQKATVVLNSNAGRFHSPFWPSFKRFKRHKLTRATSIQMPHKLCQVKPMLTT